MNPSEISIISKKMESMSMTHDQRVVRHKKRLPQSRYSPYKRTRFATEKQKEEAMQLGVELSLFVAEAMFLLSDDLRSMLLFCVWPLRCTWKKGDKEPNQVVRRLTCVMLYVFETYIKPKNGVYKEAGKSNHSELILKSSESFTFCIRELDRIVLALENRFLVKPFCFERFNQELKKLEETVRCSKDVLEANGFARDVIKSNILDLWKSSPTNMFPWISFCEMINPVLNESRESICTLRLASLHI